MTSFEHTLTIRRSPPEVFAFLMVAENNPAWQPSLLGAAAVTGGPVQVGWRFRERRRIMGRLIETEFVVEDFDAPHLCCIKAVSGLVGVCASYRLRPIDQGTRLTAQGAVPERFLPRVAARAVCCRARHDLVDNLARLKQVLEATPRPAPSRLVGASA
jgi:hypothetical protein